MLTQAAAIVALEHKEDTLRTVAKLSAERDRVVELLRELGYYVVPSESNFVCFGRFTDPHVVWQQFLDHDVLIRDNGVPGLLRATIGLPEENDAFLSAAQALADTVDMVH